MYDVRKLFSAKCLMISSFCFDTIHACGGRIDGLTDIARHTYRAMLMRRAVKTKSFHLWFYDLCWHSGMKVIHKLGLR